MNNKTANFEFNTDELVYLIKGLETAVDYAVLKEDDTRHLETKFKKAFKELYNG